MSIALYMDEHIPQDVTDELTKRGVDVITVQDDGLTGGSDSRILNRATKLERVVVTSDDDFLREAARRRKVDVNFHGVIYIRKPRDVSIGKLIDDLEIVAEAADSAYFADRKIEYLPY